MTKRTSVDLARTVETFESHPPVVHYQCACPADLNGERLLHELIAAGVPDFDRPLEPHELPAGIAEQLQALGLKMVEAVPRLHVTVYPYADGPVLDIAVPYDVDEDRSAVIADTIGAHLGSQHPDEIALRAFVDGVADAAQRLLDGEPVTDEEQRIVMAVVARHLAGGN